MSLHHHKNKRVSVDLPYEEHLHLKIACARQGIPIRQFIIDSIEKNLKELEELQDEISYDRAKKEVKSHGTLTLKELDTHMGMDV